MQIVIIDYAKRTANTPAQYLNSVGLTSILSRMLLRWGCMFRQQCVSFRLGHCVSEVTDPINLLIRGKV